jgi:hypothetical protein
VVPEEARILRPTTISVRGRDNPGIVREQDSQVHPGIVRERTTTAMPDSQRIVRERRRIIDRERITTAMHHGRVPRITTVRARTTTVTRG